MNDERVGSGLANTEGATKEKRKEKSRRDPAIKKLTRHGDAVLAVNIQSGP